MCAACYSPPVGARARTRGGMETARPHVVCRSRPMDLAKDSPADTRQCHLSAERQLRPFLQEDSLSTHSRVVSWTARTRGRDSDSSECRDTDARTVGLHPQTAWPDADVVRASRSADNGGRGC